MRFWNIEAKVGLVVVIGIVLLAVLLFNATNWPWSASGDLLRVEFNRANDIHIGAGVLLSGVNIGKVTGIELKTDQNKVLILMHVEDAFERLRQGLEVHINTIGLVGEAYIDLINGPIGAPLIKPTDLPLTGEDPKGFLDIMEKSETAVVEATKLTRSVNELMQSNQGEIREGIKEVRELIAQTSQAVESVVRNTEETVTNVNRLMIDNDRRLQQTFGRLNGLINQLESDSLMVSSSANDITRTVRSLVHRNSPAIEQTISDLRASSFEFRQASQQLRQDMTTLNSELSALIAQSRSVIDAETPKVDRVLENLTSTTENLDVLQDNLNQFLEKAQHGEGTVAQLLTKPDAIDEARKTLQTVNETMGEVKELSQTLNNKSSQLKWPELSWDYELRYLSSEESLHNELAFLLLPSDNQRYRLGLGVRDEDVKFEFQYGYDITNYLRARVGFMRSKPGAGLDLWLLSRRLGLTVEGVRLTSDDPELNAELTWKFFSHGYLIIGAENLTNTDDINYTVGFRLAGRNW